MTDCPAAESLTRFLDSALDASAAARVEAHVEWCPTCQSALDKLTSHRGPTWLLTTLVAPAGGSGASPPPDVPGYDLLNEAGRGGHGVVYRARDRALGREVAVKFLRHGAHATPGERARLLAEARATARLRHPNVLPVHAAGEVAGLPYLISEWAAGGALSARLDGTPLPERAAAALVAPLARAADHAHQAGVTHRDIKPANVLLPGPTLADPRLGDFGLARVADAAGHTPSAATLGTPSYMAPEQATGDSGAAGPAADVYALGAVLYELLTGRPPFRGESPFATLVQVRELDPVPPSRLRPALSRDLETVCLKCLEKDPRRRYPTAAALGDDLDRFLSGRPVLARPVGRAERLLRWSRRQPGTAALAAALVVVLVGSLAGLTALWRRAEAHAVRADAAAADATRRQADARESLRLYTAAAIPLLRTPAAVGPPERAAVARALELYEGVLADAAGDPDEEHRAAFATLQLADVMRAAGETGPAARACRRAVAVLGRLAEAHPGRADYRFDHAQGCSQLGSTLAAGGNAGEQAEAVGFHRTAVRAGEELARRFPASSGYRAALAGFRSNLAVLLHRQGDFRAAEDLYRDAAAAHRGMIDRGSGDPLRYADYRAALTAYAQLVLYREADATHYLEIVREPLDLCDRLLRERPARVPLARVLLPGFLDAARVLDRAGRGRDAGELLDRGLAGWEQVTAAAPADLDARREYATWLAEDGHRLLAAGLPTGAARFREAVRVLEQTVAAGGRPGHRAALADLLATCPAPSVKDLPRAVALAREAVAGDPLPGGPHGVLGLCLYETGNFREAAAELEACLGRGGDDSLPRFGLYRAMAAWQLGEQDAARAALRQVPTTGSPLWFRAWETEYALGRAWRLIAGKPPPVDRPPGPRPQQGHAVAR